MKKDELIIIGGIVIVFGAVIFWKDIAKFVSSFSDFKLFDTGAQELPEVEEEYGEEEEEDMYPLQIGGGGSFYDKIDRYKALKEEDYGEDTNCKINFSDYANYYATRVGEELEKHADENVGKNTKLEVKGRVLLSYKDELKKMYKINKKCVRALRGEARAIFIDVILRVADRMNINIPDSRRRDWMRLVHEELREREPRSVFAVTKISVM